MSPTAREALETGLRHRFARPEQLEIALTHRSFGDGRHNETLEFLGDAVLALAMADLLMARFPSAREGELSKMRASLVNAEVLARKAREIDLGRWLRLGKGEEECVRHVEREVDRRLVPSGHGRGIAAPGMGRPSHHWGMRL